MVDDRPKLLIQDYWVPTREAGERIPWMQYEYVINARGEAGEPTLNEIVWSTDDVERALADLPPILPGRIRQFVRGLLQPWPAGRYVEAYRRIGGILNVFTPKWGEAEDETWAALVTEAGPVANCHFGADRRELAERWNHTPHPFFAGLTPAQVLVGGGPQEADLSDEFLKLLNRESDRKPFHSEGEMLIHTLKLLRGWQSRRQADGRTPFEIIVAERSALLARRQELLSRRQLEL